MKLSNLLMCQYPLPVGTKDVEVSKIEIDSRNVSPGSLFVAVSGTQQDGHAYLDEAVKRGACALVVEKTEGARYRIPVVQVENSREVLSYLSNAYYGHPSRDLICFGVTGTNGKTTTAYLIQALLKREGIQTGLLGTVGYDLIDRKIDSGQTTPGPLELAYYFKEVLKHKGQAIVVEVSSHALDQKRVQGIDFDCAIFTNLSQDHLDYHGSIENYFLTKEKLFSELLAKSCKKKRWSVISLSNQFGIKLFERLGGEKISYGWSDQALFYVKKIKTGLDKTDLVIGTPQGDCVAQLRLLGSHNVENLMAALAAVWPLGIDLNQALQGIDQMDIPGRLERFKTKNQGSLFIDYAHSPDALKNVLETLRPLTQGKLHLVFGCGGERDKGKRALMGQVASLLADQVILTNDNPRGEDPEQIVKEIQKGIETDSVDLKVELNREKAIALAMQEVSPEDVILIAGKGHEKAQWIGNQRISLSDQEVVCHLGAEPF